MKKIILILVVLLAAAPAMAVVTITATQVGTTDEVDLIVTWSGEGSPPRAFAIDVNVGGGQTITGVSGYHTGDSNASGKGYGIFPASFARVINPDFNNWDDVNYTPVADVNDLPGDTEGGIGTSGVTLELGSLYVGAPNAPTSPVTLARIKVSDDCTMCFARNVGRGKVVLEDGNEPSSFSAPCFAVTVVCTVPDVVGDTNQNAQLAIIAADFNVGVITTDCNDNIADGNVISTNPAAGATPSCGSAVDIVVSTGPCACTVSVPDVAGMEAADAKAAILAADLTLGSCSLAFPRPIVIAGRIISTDPNGGVEVACGSAVDYVVSNSGDVAGGTSPDGELTMADKNLVGDWVNAYGVGRPLAIPSTDTANYVLCADVDGDDDLDMADKNLIGDWVNAFGAGRPLSIPCACP